MKKERPSLPRKRAGHDVTRLIRIVEDLTMTVAELQSLVAAIQQQVTDVAAKVDALKNQPPPVASQADLDGLGAGLTTVQSGLEAIKSA